MKKMAGGATDKSAFRRMLVTKRQEIVSAMDMRFDTLARMGRVAEDDQAQISHDEFISLQKNRIDYGQLRLIEEALDRVDSGDYGICLGCDDPIPEKRLLAIPWARYCIPCQEREAAGVDLEQEAVLAR